MSAIPPPSHGRNSAPVDAVTSIQVSEESIPSYSNAEKLERKQEAPVSLTDREITLQLMAAGILPTPQEAKELFWALGDDWWKQMIDGCYQQFGPMVFDQNLHKGYGAEPGYLKGVEDGCRYFTDRFHEELNFELYRGLHHAACSHFKGNSNATECDASKIDSVRASVGAIDFKYIVFHAYQRDKFPHVTDESERSKQMHQYVEMLGNEIDKVTSRFGFYFNDFEVRLENNEAVFILYYILTGKPLEETAQKLFEEFNINLSSLRREIYQKRENSDFQTLSKEYQIASLNLIAKLYAELEWLHPWIDGQGRADLILLNGLLCREGIHPCILDFPYYSTFRGSLEDWKKYLIQGLIKYEQVAAEKQNKAKSLEAKEPIK